MALSEGSMGIALVNGQVTLIRGSRSHSKNDRLLDVQLYKPVAQNVFLCESHSNARIYSKDLKTVLPSVPSPEANRKMIQLPYQSFCEFKKLSTSHSRRIEHTWCSAVSKMRVRLR